MDINNPKYKNQGIHGLSAIFTVEDGAINVLLIRRKKEPFKGRRIMVGGAIHNDETIDDGLRREIKEKTGIKDIYIEQFGVYSNPARSPWMRMVAVSYIALIDSKNVKILRETSHTTDAAWFNIRDIPKLGYDHEEILNDAIIYLKKVIFKSNIAKALLNEKFTMPELQRVYETLLEKGIDRRNFRKKLLSLGIVEETKSGEEKKVGKPAKYYRFKKNTKEEKSLF
jgi:8-oxo-dGTP diphosphatase